MRIQTAVFVTGLLTAGALVAASPIHVAAQSKAGMKAENAARRADQDDEAEAAAARRSEAQRRAAERAAEAGHLDDPEGIDPLDDGDGLDDHDDELDDGGDYLDDDLSGEEAGPGDEAVVDAPGDAPGGDVDAGEADLGEVEATDDLDALHSDAYLDAPSTADPVDDAPAGPSTSLEIFRAAERSLEGSGELGADYDDDFAGSLEIPGEQ
jgi:hypothetical protein